MNFTRRQVLAAGTSAAVAAMAGRLTWAGPTTRPRADRRKLRSVPVTLLPSRHSRQVAETRQTYLSIPDDDLLYGFRRRAKLPTPGKPMTGWCDRDSGVIFGQVVSGLARLGSYLKDPACTGKAIRLHEGWLKTLGPDGDFHDGTYGFDKFACGLVDLKLFAGVATMGDLARMTDWASKHFDRTRSPGGPLDWDGRKPKGTLEWYTLGENLYRAFEITGNERFKSFADVWQYPAFWDKLVDTNRPTTAHSVHAYSHVNSFCSAAMAYAVTGDDHFLRIITNAYDYLLGTQCYATGGFGPVERLVAPDGRLGRALSYVTDHAEIGCGSWAAFKLSKYLIEFTGDGRFGDWTEKVFYNSIGASLPVMPDGRTFYYADYRPSGGDKLYYWANWPCCSGTYIQAVADYHAMSLFRDDTGMYVNLFTPMEATETIAGSRVTIRVETSYPESPDVRIKLSADKPAAFDLGFRVPAWCDGMTIRVNGQAFPMVTAQGWLTVHRAWADGDRIDVTLPMTPRVQAVDGQHPDRAAVVYGPVVLAQEARYTRPLMLKEPADAVRRFKPADRPLHFRVDDEGPQDLHTGPFKPYYDFGVRETYRMYHDLKEPYLY